MKEDRVEQRAENMTEDRIGLSRTGHRTGQDKGQDWTEQDWSQDKTGQRTGLD